MHGGITFEPHQLGNLNRTRLTGTTEVVTQQVDDHHVLGPVLVAAHEFRGEICILFGVAMGVGFGIVLEVADTSVHTARQLQAHFDAPVLAEIPEIWLESDRLGQRRARFRSVVATLGAVAFAIICDDLRG